MKCPKCQKRSDVIDSRQTTFGMLRRRRECRNCQHRWTTYEIPADDLPPSMFGDKGAKETARNCVANRITELLGKL